MSQPYTPTPRTRLVREADRAVYDRETAYRILDEGFLCHVGFVADGQPFVIPTSYGRKVRVYIFTVQPPAECCADERWRPVCVTVTLLDGLVLARSIFNHSMNYRSVVVLGKATLVEDAEEKLQPCDFCPSTFFQGRWADARQPNERELKATSVLRVPIEEFSAKVRTGPVVDDEEDYSFPTWAGVVPLEMKTGGPISDTRLLPGQTVPE